MDIEVRARPVAGGSKAHRQVRDCLDRGPAMLRVWETIGNVTTRARS